LQQGKPVQKRDLEVLLMRYWWIRCWIYL